MAATGDIFDPMDLDDPEMNFLSQNPNHEAFLHRESIMLEPAQASPNGHQTEFDDRSVHSSRFGVLHQTEGRRLPTNSNIPPISLSQSRFRPPMNFDNNDGYHCPLALPSNRVTGKHTTCDDGDFTRIVLKQSKSSGSPTPQQPFSLTLKLFEGPGYLYLCVEIQVLSHTTNGQYKNVTAARIELWDTVSAPFSLDNLARSEGFAKLSTLQHLLVFEQTLLYQLKKAGFTVCAPAWGPFLLCAGLHEDSESRTAGEEDVVVMNAEGSRVNILDMLKPMPFHAVIPSFRDVSEGLTVEATIVSWACKRLIGADWTVSSVKQKEEAYNQTMPKMHIALETMAAFPDIFSKQQYTLFLVAFMFTGLGPGNKVSQFIFDNLMAARLSPEDLDLITSSNPKAVCETYYYGVAVGCWDAYRKAMTNHNGYLNPMFISKPPANGTLFDFLPGEILYPLMRDHFTKSDVLSLTKCSRAARTAISRNYFLANDRTFVNDAYLSFRFESGPKNKKFRLCVRCVDWKKFNAGSGRSGWRSTGTMYGNTRAKARGFVCYMKFFCPSCVQKMEVLYGTTSTTLTLAEKKDEARGWLSGEMETERAARLALGLSTFL